MSTIPTEIVQATESPLDIESIKSLMDGFDPAALLPDLSDLFGSLATLCRFAVMIGPVVLLVLGLAYLFLSPREANYYFGYRCYFGMGSVQAWRFTQRIAGMLFGGVGLILTIVMFLISALLTFLDKGAVQIASDYGLNEYASQIISGITLFFILGSEFFINYKVKFRGQK